MMRTLLIALFALTLTACGFHLRGIGAGAPPYASIRVVGSGDFADLLRDYLAQDKQTKLIRTGPADVLLTVRDEQYRKEIQSINNVGRAAEYRLIYQLSYQVQQGDTVILENGKHILTRTLTWNVNDLLAKESEEAMLQKDMRQDAIQLVLLRVNAAVRQAQ